jgi:hypothetical protein
MRRGYARRRCADYLAVIMVRGVKIGGERLISPGERSWTAKERDNCAVTVNVHLFPDASPPVAPITMTAGAPVTEAATVMAVAAQPP